MADVECADRADSRQRISATLGRHLTTRERVARRAITVGSETEESGDV